MTDTALAHRAVIDAIGQFRKSFPEVNLQIEVGVSQEQLALLRHEDIDLALVFLNPNEANDLHSRRLASENFRIVVPAGHRLLAKKELNPRDLADDPLILPARHYARRYNDRLLATLQQFGVSPTIATEVLNVDQMLSMVEAGIGLGFINESKIDHVPSHLRVLDVAHLPAMEFATVWPKNRAAARAEAFREILWESFAISETSN